MIILDRKRLVKIGDQKVIVPSMWPKIIISTIFLISIIWVFNKVDPNFENMQFLGDALKGLFNFEPFKVGAFNEITINDTISKTLGLLVDTFSFAILGTLLGILIAIPLSFLASKQIMKKAYIWMPVKSIVSVVRSIPPLTYAFIFFLLLSPSLSALVSLAIFVSSIMTKWMSEELDSIDLGPYETLISFGNTKFKSILKGVMPTFMHKVIGYGLYAFEMVVRFATILAFVGIPTIGIMFMDPYNQTARWGHMLVSLIILIAIIIMIELISMAIKKYVLNRKEKQVELTETETQARIAELVSKKPKTWILYTSIWSVFGILIIIALTKISFQGAGAVKYVQFKEGIGNLFNPEWSLITDFSRGDNAVVLGLTVVWIAIASVIIGTIFGSLFGILASRNISGNYVSWLFKVLIISIRSIPSFVFAIVFITIIAHGSDFAAVMALGIRSIGMLGKLTYEKIESIDPGAKLSMDVSGNNTFNSTRIAVISEALPTIASNSLFRVEINFKTITEVGAVGASAFGFQILALAGSPTNWSMLTPFIIVMVVFVLSIEQISNLVRKKITQGYFTSQNNPIIVKMTELRLKSAIIVAKATNQKLAHSAIAQNWDVANFKSNEGWKEEFNKTKAVIEKEYEDLYTNKVKELEQLIINLEQDINKASDKEAVVEIKHNYKILKSKKTKFAKQYAIGELVKRH